MPNPSLKSLLFFPVLVILVNSAWSQKEAYYPTEIHIGLAGGENTVPGCTPNTFVPFSFSRLIVQKDLPSLPTLSNTLSFNGFYERFLSISNARDYHPMLLNPILRTYGFINDIFSVGGEANANLESIPGNKNTVAPGVFSTGAGSFNQVSAYYKKRLQLSPFLYIAPHPNLLLEERLVLGWCRNTGESNYRGNPVVLDYDEIRYEMKSIFLWTHFTTLVAKPFLFYNRYLAIPALSSDGTYNPANPRLREHGLGLALGIKSHSARWGIWQWSGECLRNADEIYGANSHDRWRARVSFEHPFFTRWIGYYASLSGTGYIAKKPIIGFNDKTYTQGELASLETTGDFILIYHWNNNLSLRPEYDCMYGTYKNEPGFFKSRFWLNLVVTL